MAHAGSLQQSGSIVPDPDKQPKTAGLTGTWAESGPILERLELARLADHEGPEKTVLLLGNSRAQYAFRRKDLEAERDSSVRWLRMTRQGIKPFAFRSIAESVAAATPDMVVLVLSEYDTHRPIDLTRKDWSSHGSVRALVHHAGAAFAFEQREAVLRLLLDASLGSYRHRHALEVRGLSRLHRFDVGTLAGIRKTPRTPGEAQAIRLRGTPPLELTAMLMSALRADRRNHLARRSMHDLGPEIARINAITRGGHADVNMALVADAVNILRSAGAQVVVIEGPLNPIAHRLYDTGLRGDFLAFMDGFSADPGFHFVPIEKMGPFQPADFQDLTHVNRRTAARFPAQVARMAVRWAGE